MKKQFMISLILLSLLLITSTNVLAVNVVKSYKLDTQKQIKLFNRYRKDPVKASIASIVPGGGQFYNGQTGEGVFFIIESATMTYLYSETKEPSIAVVGLFIKVMEMCSAYDSAKQHNRNLKKKIIDFTERLEIKDNKIGLKFSF
jgi:hypothetical protein